jgi:hypothetical protein
LYFSCHFLDYFLYFFVFFVSLFCISLGILWLFFVFVRNCLYFVIIFCNYSYLY